MTKRKKNDAKSKDAAETSYQPDPELLKKFASRIKPLAKLRIYLSYLYILILLIFGGARSLTGFLYFMIGTIFIMAGGFQRFGAAGTLVKAATKDSDGLTMSGPYGKSRHPLYFGSFLNGIGFAFIAGPLGDLFTTTRESPLGLIPWGLLPFLILLVPVYTRMIKIEEEFLAVKFGPVFQKYCQTVPCFIPKLTILTRDPNWIYDPVKVKANGENSNFWAIMGVWAAFFIKMLYFLITKGNSISLG